MPKGNWEHGYYKGTGFKKGHQLVSKGKLFKIGEHNGVEFKKGIVPWNKGMKGLYTTTKKGKKYPEVSNDNHHNWKGGISFAYKVKKVEEVNPRPSNCEICGEMGVICYEHDHATGKFRGWVCSPCNIIMGIANDRVDKLEKIIIYLKKHDSKSN